MNSNNTAKTERDPLGWRPVFRRKMGAGHKGSQDFCWSILAPIPQAQTIWMREEKPRAA